MDNGPNGRESQAVGAPFPIGYPWPAPLPSTESNGVFLENHSEVDQSHQTHRTQDPSSSDVVAPQILIVPADENYGLDLQLLSMANLGATYYVSNPYSDQPPLHDGESTERLNEIVGGVSKNHFMEVCATSQVCNPYSDKLPLHIDDLDLRLKEIVRGVSENHFMEVGATSQVYNPYSGWPSLPICDSNVQSGEIVGGVLKNYYMDVEPTSYFYNSYYDLLTLNFDQLDERPSEIVVGVSENQCRVGQSLQINYPTGAMSDDPSSEAVAPPNSTVLAKKTGQFTSISQSTLPFDCQKTAGPSAFPAVGYPPSTSYTTLGPEFRQNNIVHSGPDNSASITKLQEDYLLKCQGELNENIDSRYLEIDHGKKIRKPNGGGRRRCYCKKSKCMQRYCECFYSGVFCDDTCGCKGCNNRIEHGTLVLNKKTEIERRDSFAFAPKIVTLRHQNSEPHGIRLSGQNKRHKRGCSCAKSKCLQNYCECYQANVKCSGACRCKGCGNMDTREHDVGPANFMIGKPTNNHVNTHQFHSNGGEMLPQVEASNNSIGRQAQMSSISSAVPLQQWVNFYGVSPNHNGTSLMLNNSCLPASANSLDQTWVPPPQFPVPEAESGMSTPFLPPLIPSNDADRRSNGQGDGEKNDKI